MKVWPFGVAHSGGGFKPPHAALAEDRRGERCGKGAHDVSGGDQEDDCRLRCRYSMKWHRNRDSCAVPGMSLAGARSAGQVVSGIHDDVSLICCSRTEQGKACRIPRPVVGGEREGVSQAALTVRDRVPLPRMPADRFVVVMKAVVMTVERRGRVVRGLCRLVNRCSREELAWRG